jgi:hypothetical protein
MRRYLPLLLLLACAHVALADGGRLRLHQRAGPFTVSLFTTPDPLRVGQADFSVAIEGARDQGLVEDAQVSFLLTLRDADAPPIVLHASHAAATSRFLQAANFRLPHAGVWRITVVVQRGNESGRCSGEFPVMPASLIRNQATWDIAAVPLFALLFFVQQWRKRSYKRARRSRLVRS